MKKPSNPKTGKKEHNHYRWALTAFVMAVALSGLLSLSSEAILENAGLLLALLILALFIGLGILFDIIGVAVTAADPRPFHSMAAHKEKGAKEALKLLRNVARLQKGLDLESVLISVGVTALISGATIGGKALGKPFAMNQSKRVVHLAGRFLHLFHRG